VYSSLRRATCGRTTASGARKSRITRRRLCRISRELEGADADSDVMATRVIGWRTTVILAVVDDH
jgi:hypothetical protein